MAGSAGSMESMARALTAIRAAMRATNCLKPMPAEADAGGAAIAVMGNLGLATRPRPAALRSRQRSNAFVGHLSRNLTMVAGRDDFAATWTPSAQPCPAADAGSALGRAAEPA